MLNQCNFIGNLGADPELRRTQDGRPVANFNLAVSERWKDKNSGEQREKTEWVRCVCWNEGLCKVLEQYVRKGARVYVSGKFQTRKWQDQDGQDRYSTEIVLQGIDAKLVMLDRRQEEEKPDLGDTGNRVQDGVNNMPLPVGGGMDDEIPFAPEWR